MLPTEVNIINIVQLIAQFYLDFYKISLKA